MTVLVCGGRDYQDKDALYAVLDKLHRDTPITKIVHGAARGADSFGAWWALGARVFSQGYPAQWDVYGKRAGFIRNQEMIDVENIDRTM
jgi:ABC-type glycerol-3-phosphate transport system substrate-binding protein